MTRGSTIANVPAETYRINALGTAGDPANALAADAVGAVADLEGRAVAQVERPREGSIF